MSDKSDSDSEYIVEDIVEMRPMPRRSRVNSEVSSGTVPGSPLENCFVQQGIDNVTTISQRRPESLVINQTRRESIESSLSPPEFGRTHQFPPIIPLNVGGIRYMTRLSTLRKYPDTMLSALFSGRHCVDKDENGNYFLDSNGDLFGYILEFLRNGSLPPNNIAVQVYKEANYYGIHVLVEKLQLKPDVATLHVKEAHRGQFPNYNNVKESVIKLAMGNAIQNKTGDVVIYAFKKEFVPRAPNFNIKHGCIVESADITIGPWEAAADEETFMRCLENDLAEEGFSLRQHDTKRKCRYYHGQNCQKFVYKLQIIFG